MDDSGKREHNCKSQDLEKGRGAPLWPPQAQEPFDCERYETHTYDRIMTLCKYQAGGKETGVIEELNKGTGGNFLLLVSLSICIYSKQNFTK